MKMTNKSGFSLLEVMIVVTIIGFLAGLGIPSLMRARAKTQETRCIDNLRLMSGAKDQWAVENYANNGDPCTETDVTPYFKRGFPTCPANGQYTVADVGEDPTCNIAGHTI
jgi:prepilin-type N-terminal cleavage/methylation domain-containing protein